MNKNTKILIGAGVGAGLGYFVAAVIVEVIAIKEERIFEECRTEMIPFEEEEENYVITDEKMPKKIVKNYSELFRTRPDIAELAAKYRGELDEPEKSPEEDFSEMSDDELDDDPDNGDIQEISIVSQGEYANAEGFSWQTLRYFDDDVVTDEHDNPIEHVEQLIGDEALVSFGELSDDNDIVYVRNLPKKVMYEVVRMNKDYAHQERLVRKSQLKRRDRIDRMGEEERHGEDQT